MSYTNLMITTSIFASGKSVLTKLKQKFAVDQHFIFSGGKTNLIHNRNVI